MSQIIRLDPEIADGELEEMTRSGSYSYAKFISSYMGMETGDIVIVANGSEQTGILLSSAAASGSRAGCTRTQLVGAGKRSLVSSNSVSCLTALPETGSEFYSPHNTAWLTRYKLTRLHTHSARARTGS